MRLDGTTIVAVKKDGKTVIAGDGQITAGETYILKRSAIKVRRIYNGEVVIGFAGSVSDAFNLATKFEAQLNKYSGNFMRACIELANLWRNDTTRNLEAMMIAANKDYLVLLTGDGNVIEPDDNVVAVGSGGNFALAAAKALMAKTNLNAREIAETAMKIAGEICIFTDDKITVEEV